MRRFLLYVALAGSLAAQVFPGAVATDSDLLVAYNRAQSTLSADLDSSSTTFSIAAASNFGDNMVVVIDDEQIFCSTFSGTTFSGCTRGFDGTAAAAHSSGATVSGYLVAAHHNLLKDEIESIENGLAGTGNIGSILRFGGTSASYPALKANGTGLLFRLADDSGYGWATAGSFRTSSTLPFFLWTVQGASADYGVTRMIANSTSINLQLLSDDWSTANTVWSIDRTGATANSFNLNTALNLNDPGTKPTCDVNHRGWIWFDEGAAGAADSVEVCAKNSSDAYAWYALASIP